MRTPPEDAPFFRAAVFAAEAIEFSLHLFVGHGLSELCVESRGIRPSLIATRHVEIGINSERLRSRHASHCAHMKPVTRCTQGTLLGCPEQDSKSSAYESVPNPRGGSSGDKRAEREFRGSGGASQCGDFGREARGYWASSALKSSGECWSWKDWRRECDWDPTVS